MFLWHCESRQRGRDGGRGGRSTCRLQEMAVTTAGGTPPVSVQEVDSRTTSGSRLDPRASFCAGLRSDYGVWMSDEEKLMANTQ